MSEELVRCPVCAEKIASDTTVCRYCDSELRAGANGLQAFVHDTPEPTEAQEDRVPIRWKAVFRDLGLAVAAVFLGLLLGVGGALATGKPHSAEFVTVLGVGCSYVLLIIVFTYSAAKVRIKRFRHVLFVGFLLTLLNVVYAFCFTDFPERGFQSLTATEFAAVLGAGLSYYFVRANE